METNQLILIIGAAIIGAIAAYSVTRGTRKLTTESIEKEATTLLQNSKTESEQIRANAKSNLREIKTTAFEENQRMEAHIKRLDEGTKLKDKQVSQQLNKNVEVKKALLAEKESIKSMRDEIVADGHKVLDLLLDTLGTTKEEASQEVKNMLVNEILDRKDRYIKHYEEDATEESVKVAKSILTGVIQRYSDKTSADHNHTLVEVKQERFKAMLVGPNCQNINHLEERYDVEIIFNDLPKTITVGGFNLMKRHIVKEAIELMKKKRWEVTPKVIDKALAHAEKKIGKIMMDKANEAVKKIGLKDVPEGILKHIGRLYFRTSYGQNALKHSLEVGMFAGLIAAEVGADIKLAREAGFLHDIGKAVSEESDKGHDVLTKEILEEYKYPENLVHAAWAHHEGEPAQSLEAKMIMAADALSASRPGARLESLDRYLERIRALEATASSFPGIKKTYAISAGREVRVFVKPGEVDDAKMSELAHDIVEKIEQDLNYPGNIKVNLIRRMRWEGVAGGKEEKAPKK